MIYTLFQTGCQILCGTRYRKRKIQNRYFTIAVLISRTKEATGASFLPKIGSREKISLSKSKASYSALDIPRGGADGADLAKKAYYALILCQLECPRKQNE